jgi:hypothetical protein
MLHNRRQHHNFMRFNPHAFKLAIGPDAASAKDPAASPLCAPVAASAFAFRRRCLNPL